LEILIENVSKRFGKTEVLSGITLRTAEEEFVSLLGPSGCGKTTLLRILAGFEKPSSGRVLFDGQEVSAPERCTPPERRNISMVFQSFALWPHLTVREHLKFPLRHHRFVSGEIKRNADERIDETMKIAGLAPLADRYPSELSGGQRQRVALARAMVVRPALLLMDEPLSALDAGLRIEMRAEIQRIHRICGCTILYVTHDQNEALAMSDRILIMNGGVIEQSASPSDIYYHPQTPFVARFVSACNLLQGRWERDIFHFGADLQYRWTIKNVGDDIKKEGVCPLRPDQLNLTTAGEGLPGVIMNVQFQGGERHYSIETSEGMLSVHIPSFERYGLGEKVFLKPREAAL
jgi:iron(III) transport system ATP-binding protein